MRSLREHQAQICHSDIDACFLLFLRLEEFLNRTTACLGEEARGSCEFWHGSGRRFKES